MARVVGLIDGSARFDGKIRQLLNALQSRGLDLIGTGLDGKRYDYGCAVCGGRLDSCSIPHPVCHRVLHASRSRLPCLGVSLV